MNLYNWIRRLKIAGKLPKKDEINSIFASFSKKEWIIFVVLLIILLASTLSILESINKSLMVSVPAYGGSVSEGIIGAPRFINPILANSPVDQDLVSLIYSGLMRKNPDGTLSPDLAEKYEMSKNGLIYTFTLKDKTIEFTLRQPYPSFLKNATIGVMPRSLWDNSPIELNEANISPIGSGPYMIKSFAKESSGVINSYELISFKKFILGEPYIKTISLHFYSNEDDLIKALWNNEVDQISSVTPLNADILKERNYQIDSSVLPRVFGLFFNQNQNQLFTDKIITQAIDQVIDKDKIVREVLFGYGVAIDNPIPPNMIAYQKLNEKDDISREEILKNAQNILAKDGWSKGSDGFLQKTTTDKNKKKKNTALEFSISTGNSPELVKTAELIQRDLAAVGIKVNIKTFEVGNLKRYASRFFV